MHATRVPTVLIILACLAAAAWAPVAKAPVGELPRLVLPEAAGQAGTYPGRYPYRFAEFSLPGDEGRHDLAGGSLSPLEWWYVVSHLDGADGHRYFVFLCWFSTGSLQVGVTDITTGGRWTWAQHYRNDEIGITTGRMDVDFAGNTLRNTEPFAYRAEVKTPNAGVFLDYYSRRPPFPVGREGVRQGYFHYPHGGYTWYYTMGRLSTQGTLKLGGTEVAVKGVSWMDRQWGLFLPLSDWRWEWMALQVLLEKGDYPLTGFLDVNAWNVRDARTGGLIWNMATALYPDGSVRFGNVTMDALAYWTSPRGYTYSHGWLVNLVFDRLLPIRLRVTPAVDDQTQQTAARMGFSGADRPEFWEGECGIQLEPSDKPVGVATVELTQYYER